MKTKVTRHKRRTDGNKTKELSALIVDYLNKGITKNEFREKFFTFCNVNGVYD